MDLHDKRMFYESLTASQKSEVEKVWDVRVIEVLDMGLELHIEEIAMNQLRYDIALNIHGSGLK